MNREDYYEFHESREELARAEEWDSMPDKCKYCRHCTWTCNCDIADEGEEDCPLENGTCEFCMYNDNGYCTENDEEVDDDGTCESFDIEKES